MLIDRGLHTFGFQTNLSYAFDYSIKRNCCYFFFFFFFVSLFLLCRAVMPSHVNDCDFFKFKKPSSISKFLNFCLNIVLFYICYSSTVRTSRTNKIVCFLILKTIYDSARNSMTPYEDKFFFGIQWTLFTSCHHISTL